MAKQLHRKFPNEQVKSLLKRYLSKEIKIGYILEILSIKRSRFFELLKEYREAPESFSISYKRQKCTRRINQKIEENIIKELQIERSLNDCRVKTTYALSPQARGKVERPYGWLQDRIVRTCAREAIRTVEQARELLRAEVNRYNNHQVHSTTGEVPSLRFHDALEEKKSLFRKLSVPPPYQSSKDIFCLRAERVVNPYRKISFNTLEFRISGVPIRGTVQLRIIPDKVSGMAEIRF